MFEVSVEAEFCAAHAIVMNGQRETVHGHNWKVTLGVRGEHLDKDGLLCDFHLVEGVLRTVIGPFNNADLNATPPFTDVNPSAEHIARHIGTTVAAQLERPLGGRAKVAWVRITEAPGCATTYWTA